MSIKPDNRIEQIIKERNDKKVFNENAISWIKFDIETFLKQVSNYNIEGLTASIVLKHIDTYSQLIKLYIADERPWSIAYSGGKDSTVTMDVCLRALLLIKYIYGDNNLNKVTYVIFSDTLLEMDPVIEGILKSIEEIKNFGIKYNLNLNVKRVSPIVKHTYFSLLIGKGYMVSRTDNRWCTDRMKILPQKKAIVKLLNENKKGFIAITGQRQDESVDRANRMKQQTIDGSFKKHEFKNCNLYAPIEHWTSNEVWTHIYHHKLEWIDENTLGRVYAEASDDGGECNSLLEGYDSGSNPGCGKSARYGCWICTLFDKDKTLNNLTKHYDYMTHMEEFRNWLVQNRQSKWDWKRDVFIHGKHKMKKYDIKNHREGMQIPGGYNLYFRKEILIRLMELERKIIKQRGKPLITDEELSYIQECWIEDGDIDMSVSEIAYDRNITISPLYERVLISIESVVKRHNYGHEWLSIVDVNANTCARFYCQFAIQLEHREYDSSIYLNCLTFSSSSISRKMSIKLMNELPVITKMDFVNQTRENYIRKEWKEDKIGFLTFLDKKDKGEIKIPQKHLFGNEGDYGTHFDALEELEEKGDIINCKLISLEDKMRFFDGW